MTTTNDSHDPVTDSGPLTVAPAWRCCCSRPLS